MGAGASALSGEGADVIGGKLTVEVASGHDLLAADGGMFSKKTSDPYVKVTLGSAVVAKSDVAKKDLNPVWNLSAEYNVGPRARKTPTLVFTVYDYDMVGSDDPLGAAEVPLKQLLGGAVFERKLALQPCKGCKKAKGEIAVRLAFLARKALTLAKGGAIDVENAGHLALAMGWDMLPGNQAVDVDASVVAFDDRGRVLTVRGKPSSRKPRWQSGWSMRSLMIATTRSSLTRPPLFMTPSASLPTSVPAATAARSMSPVLSCGVPSCSTMRGACVPLPAPGGPKRMMIVRFVYSVSMPR